MIKDVMGFRITEFSFVKAFVPDAKVESQRAVNNPWPMDAVFRLRKHTLEGAFSAQAQYA